MGTNDETHNRDVIQLETDYDCEDGIQLLSDLPTVKQYIKLGFATLKEFQELEKTTKTNAQMLSKLEILADKYVKTAVACRAITLHQAANLKPTQIKRLEDEKAIAALQNKLITLDELETLSSEEFAARVALTTNSTRHRTASPTKWQSKTSSSGVSSHQRRVYHAGVLCGLAVVTVRARTMNKSARLNPADKVAIKSAAAPK